MTQLTRTLPVLTRVASVCSTCSRYQVLYRSRHLSYATAGLCPQ